MASANGSIIGSAWNSGSWAYSSTAARYAGYAGTNEYYVTFFQFKTPSFAGVSSSVSFNLYLSSGKGTTVNFRYAICTSDANHSKYHGTISAVTDSYQVTSGTTSIDMPSESSGLLRTITINTASLKTDTTYYLALWSYDNTGVSVLGVSSWAGTDTVTLNYISSYTVQVAHYRKKRGGDGWEYFITEAPSVSAGASYTPTIKTPPTIEHTINGVTYAAWTAGYASKIISNAIPGATSFAVNSDCIVEVYYPLRLSYIDTGSEIAGCQMYIDNGESFEVYVPYVDNGTSWTELV